ncbi:MAG: hypothetical protein ISS26_03605 [Candidatus Omnitrophica bacterium]|nr:hypothetical protein [Candidatus Omnitrophota bacterium]
MIELPVKGRIRKYIFLGIAASLFIILAPIQQSINFSRMTEDLVDQIVIIPGEFVTNFVIGGFRGLAADIMWVKIDHMWHSGRWFEVMPVLRSITWMQPHFIEAWELGAWHLAYNLYAYAGETEEAGKYIEEGIRFLKEGVAKNRNTHDLWFGLGWIYYNKLKNNDEGARYFKIATRFDHPSYIDRMVAHAYRKKGDIESEYKQWQHCLTVFTDDEYHINISKRHLEAAGNRLREEGGL